MRFYFIRHGQTEFNQHRIIQGREVDSPLTEQGIIGAKKLGIALSDIQFQHVFASSQKRAMDTAKYVLEENHHAVPNIQPDPRLRELYFGKFEGKPIDDFAKNGYFDDYKNHPDTFDASTTNGETYYDVRDRGFAAMKDIMAQCRDNDNVMVVAHSIFLTTLTRSLLGVPMKDIRKEGVLRNTSVTVIDIDQSGHCHLVAFDYVPE